MNKVILITGSTDGIGKLAAIKLAKEGHEVYLHGRNPEKLASAIAEVRDSSENAKVKGFIADLSDLIAVQKMAQQVREELPKMDVLINNAGVFNSPVHLNRNGLDMRFVVNYLAPYLLTNELMPILKKGVEPRIVNLSSAAQSPVSYEVLAGKAKQSVNTTYAQSKLALTMWSFYLAQKEDEINVMAVNPGSLLNTKMVKEAFGHHWSSADKGANILHDLAVGANYRGITGKYFDNDKGAFGKAHADAYKEAEIQKLINVTNSVLAEL